MTIRTLLILATFGLVSHAAGSAELTLVVKDENGQPLANAVITAEQPAASSDAVEKHEIVQRGREFVPNTTLIRKGDTVTFPNQDSLRHHVYSFSSTRTFEFELYGGDVSPSMDFPQAGLVVLGCNIHDDMIGYIMISDSTIGGVTDDTGTLRFDPGEATEFTIWHGAMLESNTEAVTLLRREFNEQQHEISLPLTIAEDDEEESELERRFKGFGR